MASCQVAGFSDSGLRPISLALGKRTIVADVVSGQGSFIGSKFLSNASWRLNTKAKNVFGWALDVSLVIRRKSLYRVGKISICLPVIRQKLLKEITNQLGLQNTTFLCPTRFLIWNRLGRSMSLGPGFQTEASPMQCLLTGTVDSKQKRLATFINV